MSLARAGDGTGDLMSDDVLEAGLGPEACTVRSNVSWAMVTSPPPPFDL